VFIAYAYHDSAETAEIHCAPFRPGAHSLAGALSVLEYAEREHHSAGNRRFTK
jgi:hypothetical protein